MRLRLILSITLSFLSLVLAKNSDSHNIKISVPVVDLLEISESGNTVATLNLIVPVAGEIFTDVTNETSLDYSTNGTARKITAQLDWAMPAGLKLEIVPTASVTSGLSCEADNTIYGTEYTGGTAGTFNLATEVNNTAVDVTKADIANCAVKGVGIQYRLTASLEAAPTTSAIVRKITYTLIQ